MKYLKKTLTALVLSVSAILTSVAIGLGIIHLTNFIYRIDIDGLGISEATGYSNQEIIKNVNAVMDYLNPFSAEEFDLPTFGYSESGASHFADCKTVFDSIYLWGAIAFIIVVLMLVFLKKDIFTYRLAAVLTLALPCTVGCAMAINFDRAFVLFHQLFFNNSDWLFNPYTDPIIKVLPAEFFMHCGIFIAGCVALAAILLFVKGGKKHDRI